MDRKKYNQLRVIVTLFVGAIVGLAVARNSYLLSIVGVLTGMVFMGLARTKAKIKVDEREAAIQEKAARMTYAIFAPTLLLKAINICRHWVWHLKLLNFLRLRSRMFLLTKTRKMGITTKVIREKLFYARAVGISIFLLFFVILVSWIG